MQQGPGTYEFEDRISFTGYQNGWVKPWKPDPLTSPAAGVGWEKVSEGVGSGAGEKQWVTRWRFRNATRVDYTPLPSAIPSIGVPNYQPVITYALAEVKPINTTIEQTFVDTLIQAEQFNVTSFDVALHAEANPTTVIAPQETNVAVDESVSIVDAPTNVYAPTEVSAPTNVYAPTEVSAPTSVYAPTLNPVELAERPDFSSPEPPPLDHPLGVLLDSLDDPLSDAPGGIVTPEPPEIEPLELEAPPDSPPLEEAPESTPQKPVFEIPVRTKSGRVKKVKSSDRKRCKVRKRDRPEDPEHVWTLDFDEDEDGRPERRYVAKQRKRGSGRGSDPVAPPPLQGEVL